MKIGIIGSGIVAQQLGLGFLRLGHEVQLGTRNQGKLSEWRKQAGAKAIVGALEDAARFGEMIVLATKWDNGATENAITLAGKDHFTGKIVIDVTNPLTFGAEGQPPKLPIGYPHSAGKMIQDWLPQSKVVKAFNIINANYMANPVLKEGIPDMFIAGNDLTAKNRVKEVAKAWGCEVHDIGDIGQSYLLEALAFLWITYGFINHHWNHAFKLLKQ